MSKSLHIYEHSNTEPNLIPAKKTIQNIFFYENQFSAHHCAPHRYTHPITRPLPLTLHSQSDLKTSNRLAEYSEL